MLTNESVFSALADLREGRVHLDRVQQADFIAAVEEVVRVVLTAPHGTDALEALPHSVLEGVGAVRRREHHPNNLFDGGNEVRLLVSI